MFRKDNKLATVSRLWYTTQSWYDKSSYTLTWKFYYWNLKALTLKDWIEVGSFWKEFQFNTDINADIKESDRLTISSVTYDVKWVSIFEWVTFSRKMVMLNKSTNG